MHTPVKTTQFENVMLIDDEEIDNLINERLIQVNYFARNVSVYTNVPAALDSVKKALETNTGIPDVIFLDMQLPQFDGFYFLDHYRELCEMNPVLKNTKVVILSAYINKYPDHLWSSYSFVVGKVNKPLSDRVLGGLQEELPQKVA